MVPAAGVGKSPKHRDNLPSAALPGVPMPPRKQSDENNPERAICGPAYRPLRVIFVALFAGGHWNAGKGGGREIVSMLGRLTDTGGGDHACLTDCFLGAAA